MVGREMVEQSEIMMAAVIDAALDLVTQGLDPAEVVEIAIAGHAEADQLTDHQRMCVICALSILFALDKISSLAIDFSRVIVRYGVHVLVRTIRFQMGTGLCAN
jgi:hypothetical protein